MKSKMLVLLSTEKGQSLLKLFSAALILTAATASFSGNHIGPLDTVGPTLPI